MPNSDDLATNQLDF